MRKRYAAFILIVLSVFQQPLLANPKTPVNDYNALQVQSEFRPIANAQLFHKGILEFPLKYIASITSPDRLSYFITPSFYGDMQVSFDFSSKTFDKGTCVIPCVIKSKDGTYVWSYEALLSKDGNVTIRKSRLAISAEYSRERIMRGLSTDEGTIRLIMESVISMCLTKKVVLVFDTGVGNIQSQRAIMFFDELARLRKDPAFGRILKNLTVIKSTPDRFYDRLSGHILDKAEIFAFVRSGERDAIKDLESVMHAVYIDTRGFPHDAYYPLPEIVAISLVNYIDPGVLKIISDITERFNISSVEEGRNVLIFRLLRSALPVSWQSFMKDYGARREVLRSL